MAITAGSNALASDFITASEKNSTPANDSGRVPQLESNGKVSALFLAPVVAKELTVQNSPASTTETTVLSHTVVAGALATGNGLRYRAYVTCNGGGVSADTTIRLKLGSTTLLSITPHSAAEGWVEMVFFNNGGTGSQTAIGTFSDIFTNHGNDVTDTGTGSESTTSNKTLLVTCQLSNSLGSYSVQFQTLEVL